MDFTSRLLKQIWLFPYPYGFCNPVTDPRNKNKWYNRMFVPIIRIPTNKLNHGLSQGSSCWKFHFKMKGGFCLVKGFVILCLIISAIFSLPEEFMCSPCRVNSYLVRFVSIILTWWISFNILCSFLLYTCISLLMQKES